MKHIKLLTILVLITFFYGCNNDSDVFVGKSKYDLKFNQEHKFPAGVPIIEEFIGQGIHIIDTLLLVQHQYENPSYYWDVYNLNNLKCLKSILRQGRGPDEVLFAHYDGQYENENGDICMLISDFNSAKFIKINLTQSIKSGKDVVELISDIEPEKSPYFLMDNNIFLYSDYNRDEGYLSLVKGDNSWKNPEIVKKIYKNITYDDFLKLSRTMYYNKKNNKVCIINGYVDHIQLIDVDGDDDMILSTAESDNWQAIRNENISESTKVFYTSTRITDDYIFSLYTNKKLSEFGDVPKEVVIHVFNWNGDAIAKICFEDYLTSFAVDMKNKVLYGINNMEQMYAYDISSCLEFSR